MYNWESNEILISIFWSDSFENTDLLTRRKNTYTQLFSIQMEEKFERIGSLLRKNTPPGYVN